MNLKNILTCFQKEIYNLSHISNNMVMILKDKKIIAIFIKI